MPQGSEPTLFNLFNYNMNEDIEGMPGKSANDKQGGYQDSKGLD